MAAVDQVTTLPAGSVRDAVGGGWRGEAALHRLGLADVIDRPVDQLSGGQEKRVSLAKALVADADLLVLDTGHPALLGHGVDTLLDALVFSAQSNGNGSPVLRVMVNGEWCVAGGRPRDGAAALQARQGRARPRGAAARQGRPGVPGGRGPGRASPLERQAALQAEVPEL